MNFIYVNLFWYNSNFIQYISLTEVWIYVLKFAVTVIVTFVSRIIAPNYITLIGLKVPITFIILIIYSKYHLDMLKKYIWNILEKVRQMLYNGR